MKKIIFSLVLMLVGFSCFAFTEKQLDYYRQEAHKMSDRALADRISVISMTSRWIRNNGSIDTNINLLNMCIEPKYSLNDMKDFKQYATVFIEEVEQFRDEDKIEILMLQIEAEAGQVVADGLLEFINEL